MYIHRTSENERNLDLFFQFWGKINTDIPGKFNMRWEGPFIVVKRKGNVNYQIVSDDGPSSGSR